MKSAVLNTLTGLIIAFGALYFGFRGIDLASVWEGMKTADGTWLWLTLGIGILSHYLRAVRWRLLLKKKSGTAGNYPFFSATMVGYAVNNVIPRGGEVGKAVYLSKKLDLDQSTVFGTVVLERLLDFIVLVLVFGITVILYAEPLNRFFPGLGLGALIVFLAAAGLIAGATLVPERKIKQLARKVLLLTGKRTSIRLSGVIVRFVHGIGSLKQVEGLGKIGFLSAGIFFCYILMSWVPMFAFPFQSNLNLSLGAGIAVMAISSIGMVIPSPGGTGTFHFFCSAVMVNLFAVSKLDAMSFATAVHLLNVVMTSGLGVGCFLLDQTRRGISRP